MPPTVNIESFFCLPLDINVWKYLVHEKELTDQDNTIISLESAMSMYTAREEIEGYKNEAGKEVPACKQVKLEQLPMVLVSFSFTSFFGFMCQPVID